MVVYVCIHFIHVLNLCELSLCTNDFNVVVVVFFKDHQFNEHGRQRLISKLKLEANQDKNRNAVARGALHVRFENARRNESSLTLSPIQQLAIDDI